MRRLLALLCVVGVVLVAYATRVLGASAPSVSIRVFAGSAVDRPRGIAAGPDGAIWFTNEEGHSIGRITPQGVLRDYTDPKIATPTAITSAPDGALWFVNGGSIGRISVTGAVTIFAGSGIGSPLGIAAAADGAIWFTTGSKAVGRMTPDGAVTTFADLTLMRGTFGITAGPDGAMWFTNYFGSSIGRISPTGTVSAFTDPSIRYPTAITTGPDGALWFTDDSGSIGRITTGGVVSSYGNSSSVGHPNSITAGPDGALWATDRGGSIVRITVAGAISRYTAATVGFPSAIAAGRDGALWFTDYSGNSIGRVALIPAAPPEPAPLVAFGRPGAATASVLRSATLTLVRAPIRVGGRASLTLKVRNPRTGRNLHLQPGSKLATTALRQPATVVKASISGARTFVVEAALARGELVRGRSYQLLLDAAGTKGKPSEIKISFRA